MKLRNRFRMLTVVVMSLTACPAAFAQPGSQPPQPRSAELTFIQTGRLLADPQTGRVELRKTIVVSDGKIVEIRDGFQSGPGLVIDLRDSFVLPGLIDSHVHITSESGPTGALDAVKKTAADRVVDGALYGRHTLRAGFTTVVDLGGEPDATYALRDGIDAGKLTGPRIVVAGTVIVHGGHGSRFGYRPDILELLDNPGRCSGADDCRRAVRQAVQRGADLIKIASTGGVMSNTASGVGQQMFDDELAAIVKTARSLGRRVTSHAHGTDGINAALRAGVSSIEHGSYLDDESLRLLKKGGAYWIPTLLAGDTVRQQAQTASWMPAAIREKALRVSADIIANAGRARAAGINVAFGTDSGVSAHGENAKEFLLMAKAGFAPLDAIRAATVWGAAHNRLSEQIGSLTPGKVADLIAVKGNPLEDLTELGRVSFVMKGGNVVTD